MYVGFDYGTRGNKIAILTESGEPVHEFTVHRDAEDGELTDPYDAITDRVPVEDINQVGVCGHYWAENFASIKPSDEFGDVFDVTKDELGVGVQPESRRHHKSLTESELPTVLVPGVNRDLPHMHDYFCHYSPLHGADPICEARGVQAFLRDKGMDGENFIVGRASTSAHALLVTDGKIRGMFHWIGLNHGWPDLFMLRQLKEGNMDFTDVGLRSGFMYKPDVEYDDRPFAKDKTLEEKMAKEFIKEVPETPSSEMLERMYWSTLHNVYSMYPFAKHIYDVDLEGIVLVGRSARKSDPFDVAGRLTDELSDLAPTYVTEPYTTAAGGAYIARDAYEGKEDSLGIPIEGQAPTVDAI